MDNVSHDDDSAPLSQYTSLRLVVITFTCLSLFCAICTATIYIWLWIDNYQHAQRLTLQFVMVATVSTIVVEILDIINWALLGNSTYCGISRTFLLFFNAVNASSLSCIGLNLVLLLYSGLATQNKAKRFYYPGIFVVSLIATSVPIYQASHWFSQESRHAETLRSCWYYSRHFDGRGESNIFWLWYFCVIFFIIVVAAILSILALWKLFWEYQNARHHLETQAVSKNVFLRVGIRCVLYTLVPFFVNVWSFVMQFTDTHHDQSSYPLAFIDAFLSSCSGLFVSAIFFSEPTLTSFISRKCHFTNPFRLRVGVLPPSVNEQSTSIKSDHSDEATINTKTSAGYPNISPV